jgi:hypothetical protein
VQETNTVSKKSVVRILFCFIRDLQCRISQPMVSFNGSGGAGKTPSPKTYFAGSRRIPSAAKPLSAANGVGRF